MSQHHNAEVANRLRKFMALRGPAVIDTVSPEIVPVVIAGDVAEQDSGGIVTYCLGNVIDAAVAGQYSHCAVFNPAASGRDVILDGVYMRTTAGAEVDVGWIADVSAYTGYTIRNAVVDIPGKVGFGAGVVLPGAKYYNYTAAATDPAARWFHRLYVANASTLPVSLGIRIEPGYGVVLVAVTVNIGLTVNFQHREIQRVP